MSDIAAGLERIGLLPENALKLDWMLPAPAQGAIMVVCREGDLAVKDACIPLNHEATATCVKIERDFLQRLMGGCTAPISALAIMQENHIHFSGQVLSIDGGELLEANEIVSLEGTENAGFSMADILIAKGADRLIRQIKERLQT